MPADHAPTAGDALGDTLVAEGVAKRYGGVVALRGADLVLRPGEVHALLGENGAGKSTLVKVLTGLEQPDAGTVRLGGRAVTWRGPLEARDGGIATVSQELSLFPDLDVLENLFSFRAPARGGLVDRRAMRDAAAPHLAALGLDVDPRTLLGDLTLAQQQLVEIARALLGDPRVLVLDEPTSALGAAATESLLATVRAIAGRGVAVLYVSHFLQEVRVIADRVTVLRDGANALTDRAAAELDVPALVAAMLGRETPEAAPDSVAAERNGDAARVCATLRDLAPGGAADGVDLDVRASEIVGLAGLQGAGHEEMLQLLWTRRRADGDVAFVPSDRKRFGLMLDKPVWENVTAVTALAGRRSPRLLRPAALRAVAQHWVDELRIRCQVDDPAGRLSGGNQQKLVFAKWLATDPRLLLLDDPTRGVDVGAKREMHTLIRRLAGQGRGVLLCSTDLAELAELCDRVLIMHRGRVTAEAASDQQSESGLLAALGGAGAARV